MSRVVQRRVALNRDRAPPQQPVADARQAQEDGHGREAVGLAENGDERRGEKGPHCARTLVAHANAQVQLSGTATVAARHLLQR